MRWIRTGAARRDTRRRIRRADRPSAHLRTGVSDTIVQADISLRQRRRHGWAMPHRLGDRQAEPRLLTRSTSTPVGAPAHARQRTARPVVNGTAQDLSKRAGTFPLCEGRSTTECRSARIRSPRLASAFAPGLSRRSKPSPHPAQAIASRAALMIPTRWRRAQGRPCRRSPASTLSLRSSILPCPPFSPG